MIKWINYDPKGLDVMGIVLEHPETEFYYYKRGNIYHGRAWSITGDPSKLPRQRVDFEHDKGVRADRIFRTWKEASQFKEQHESMVRQLWGEQADEILFGGQNE